MRKWRKFGLCSLSIAIVGLSGCAGMSQNECQLADWRAVGYEDGSRGQAPAAFGERRQACAKHGVTPDFQAYQAGRNDGLREYCQPARGFDEGRRGARYMGVCPGSLEQDFMGGYTEGRTLYQLESAVRSTTRQIKYHESRIKEIEKELADIAAAFLTDEMTGEERARLLVETKQLAEERVTLASDLDDLEHDLVHQQEELAAQQAQLVTRY
jgi:hypothetical protein